jgi:hypothetical protein
LLVPVGSSGSVQQLELRTRRQTGNGNDAFVHRKLDCVRFVLFIEKGSTR